LTDKNFQFNRVLDLTDIKLLNQLKISPEELIMPIEKGADAYKSTHIIGDLARKLDFDALIVPSASNSVGINIAILKK
jgi:hypothetical protein